MSQLLTLTRGRAPTDARCGAVLVPSARKPLHVGSISESALLQTFFAVPTRSATFFIAAGEPRRGTRTPNRLITNQVLCQLSYLGKTA